MEEAKKHRISFSTLGCPNWTLHDSIYFAAANGYDGIEVRGILNELDLPRCNDFNTDEKIKTVRKMAEDRQIRIVDLGSSAQMHEADPEKRKDNLDSAKRFIDLGCPSCGSTFAAWA